MMWELIRANKRKSIILLLGMILILSALGFFIGGAFDPKNGPFIGLIVALGIAVFMGITSYFFGDNVITSMSNAKPASRELHPQLFNVVEEMKIAASLPKMPKIYISQDLIPNAFAAGRDPENSAIVVTAGLLSRLNRDELQGVIAHEIGHILNRDVLFMTICGVVLGSIIFISETFKRVFFYSSVGGSRYSSRRNRGGKGGGAQLVFLLIALLLTILAPIFARILYFAASRKREFLADAESARLTRYPAGLASALEKISVLSTSFYRTNDDEFKSKVIAPMYIVNPLAEMKAGGSIFSTHPPTHVRVMILRNMANGAGYRNYQEAYEKVMGKKRLIPESGLRRSETVQIRKPSVDAAQEKANRSAIKDAGDLIRAMNNFLFITCICGLKIKLPPDYKKDYILCPRCGRKNQVPIAELAGLSLLAEKGLLDGKLKKGLDAEEKKEPERVYKYKRKTPESWETFKCPCGGVVQLSPIFKGKFIKCPKCNAKVEIEQAA